MKLRLMYLIIYRQLYVCFIGYLSDVVNFINSTANLLKQVGWVFKVLEYILVAPCSNSTIIYSLSYLMNINSAPYSHLQNSHMVFFHLRFWLSQGQIISYWFIRNCDISLNSFLFSFDRFVQSILNNPSLKVEEQSQLVHDFYGVSF